MLDPVVFLEPLALYRNTRAWVPDVEPAIEDGSFNLDGPYIVKNGADLTMVAYGAMAHRALQAAEIAAETLSISVEVIDLCAISPLDIRVIAKSVRKTGALIVAHESPRSGDVGAEIFARLAQVASMPRFAFRRVTGWDTPFPFPGHEHKFVANQDRLLTEIEALAKRARKPARDGQNPGPSPFGGQG